MVKVVVVVQNEAEFVDVLDVEFDVVGSFEGKEKEDVEFIGAKSDGEIVVDVLESPDFSFNTLERHFLFISESKYFFCSAETFIN